MNLKLKGITGREVHELLSVIAGTSTLVVPQHNRGMGSIVNKFPGESRTFSITLKRGDSYLRSLDLPRVRLIKIDVEGHEAAVLNGARTWIRQNKPEVIVFENNGSEDDRHSVVSILVELGYNFYGLPKSKLRMRLIAVKPTDVTHFHDVVAVHETSQYTP